MLVYGLSDDVENATKRARADRNHDWCTSVLHLLASDKALSRLHLRVGCQRRSNAASVIGKEKLREEKLHVFTSILMVRTVFSPKCWATSSTRRGLPAATVTSRALRIGGSGPSN